MLTVMFENEAQGSIKPAQKGKAAAPAHKENAPIANIKGRGAKPVGRGNGGKGLGVLWKLWLPARREHVSDLVVSKNEDQKHAGVRCLNGIAFNDHYKVLQKLGAGAFGTVSKVERVADGKEFAAKEVLFSQCKLKGQWNAAHDEVRVWTAVSWTYHPSILQLVEVVHLENVSLHLVTELMSGGDLQGAIDGGVYSAEMSEKNVRLITVQIAAAIAHLHQAHSMAHRDIKPQNVLCRWRTNPMKAGSLKLTDFGFSAEFSGSPKEPCFSLYAGSMDYFAPELARIVRAVRGDSTRSPSECRACDCLNERCPLAPEWPQVRRKEPQKGMKYSAAVDCYALGCVVYQMLNGSTPHFSADEDEQLDKIVEGGLAYPREPFGQVQESADRMQHVLARQLPRRLAWTRRP
jgi:serine/threonine protein kinase